MLNICLDIHSSYLLRNCAAFCNDVIIINFTGKDRLKSIGYFAFPHVRKVSCSWEAQNVLSCDS